MEINNLLFIVFWIIWGGFMTIFIYSLFTRKNQKRSYSNTDNDSSIEYKYTGGSNSSCKRDNNKDNDSCSSSFWGDSDSGDSGGGDGGGD